MRISFAAFSIAALSIACGIALAVPGVARAHASGPHHHLRYHHHVPHHHYHHDRYRRYELTRRPIYFRLRHDGYAETGCRTFVAIRKGWRSTITRCH